jgi:hypothetical protein
VDGHIRHHFLIIPIFLVVTIKHVEYAIHKVILHH